MKSTTVSRTVEGLRKLFAQHVDVRNKVVSDTGVYTCLFRQMARLLLKISRCLAYAAQPAMILRCISLSGCSVVPSTRSLGHFLSAHCSRL